MEVASIKYRSWLWRLNPGKSFLSRTDHHLMWVNIENAYDETSKLYKYITCPSNLVLFNWTCLPFLDMNSCRNKKGIALLSWKQKLIQCTLKRVHCVSVKCSNCLFSQLNWMWMKLRCDQRLFQLHCIKTLCLL